MALEPYLFKVLSFEKTLIYLLRDYFNNFRSSLSATKRDTDRVICLDFS